MLKILLFALIVMLVLFFMVCLYHLWQMFERGGKEMKKFTTTLLLAIGLLVGFTVNAQAVNAATLNMSYSDYWYDRAKADGSEHHSWHLLFTIWMEK